MAFDCVTKRQKKGPVESRAEKGNATMDTVSLDSKAATKVIAKACTLVDRRKAVQVAPLSQKAREVGRYKKSGDELAEAVEHYRKKTGA